MCCIEFCSFFFMVLLHHKQLNHYTRYHFSIFFASDFKSISDAGLQKLQSYRYIPRNIDNLSEIMLSVVMKVVFPIDFDQIA